MTCAEASRLYQAALEEQRTLWDRRDELTESKFDDAAASIEAQQSCSGRND